MLPFRTTSTSYGPLNTEALSTATTNTNVSDANAGQPQREERERGRAFYRNLPEGFRDRSSSRERQLILSRLAPDIATEFGTETESKHLGIVPGGKRKDILSELQYAMLEIDTNFVSGKSNTERVTKPTVNADDVDKGCIEYAEIVNRILQHGRATDTTRVPLHSVLPEQRPERKHQSFKIRSPAPTGKLQSTAGIRLDNFNEALEYLPSRKMRERIQGNATKVESLLSQRCGNPPLSEELRGFIKLILYYMEETRGATCTSATVHGYFHFMMRSDYHSTFHKLLMTSEDRALGRVLLLSPKNGEPLLLRAIGKKGSERVFENGYMDEENKRKRSGPRLQDWFHSIVHGNENDGPYAKDALSPPPGYSAKTYSMGATGVDPANKTALFEFRGHKNRKLVLLNAHMRTVHKLELQIARQLNPGGLGNPDELKITRHEVKWVDSSSPAMIKLGKFHVEFHQLLRDGHPRRARGLINTEKFQSVRDFRSTFRKNGWDKRYPEVVIALKDFFDATLHAHAISSTNFTGKTFSRSLDTLLQALWNIDQTLQEDSDNET